MAPSRNTVSKADPIVELSTTYSLTLLAAYTHTLDSLPLDLSRNFADLRELDAVLSSSMTSITNKINDLTRIIEQGLSSKEERLWLLTEIAEEAGRLKLGGEDKIRVASQAADNLKCNANYLRLLAEHLPGFDASTLNRRTVYPHIATKSYMPAISLETGRRRRGGYGSLLVAAPDISPAKRKRTQRDEDLDLTRSPKKDKGQETNPRSRARPKKADRAASPSESILSITSHTLPQSLPQNGSRGAATNGSSRANGSTSASAGRRARGSAQNNRSNTPNDRYLSPHDQNGNTYPHPNGHTNAGTTSRRDTYHNSAPSAMHSSIHPPYVNGNGTHAVNPGHHHSAPYDVHMMSQGIPATSDWNPPLPQQLEGPGMPIQRGNNVHPIISVNATVSGLSTGTEGADAVEGDGDGDDKVYCICNNVSYGEMIACDDSQCEREWFHLNCINLTTPPEGRWFCDECKNKRNKRSNKGGKRRTGGGGRSNARS